ncbi:MAG TPA: SurA N-terminal domain-containing protein [Candidatus Saccharimonadales bacterium]|nr:SurA N-terminal domain-containing protein [Candidatus Saccharimonadales bacterium]
MIGTIRRHQQWLWIVIIIAICVSFVIYFTPSRKFGMDQMTNSSVDLGTVNGQAITPQQLHDAEQEARVFFRLHYGEWPDTEDKKVQVRHWAEQRLLLDAELRDYHIVVPASADARLTKQIFGLRPDEALPMDKFNEFAQNELARKGGVSLDDFERFVHHQAGQEYLVALLGMSGKLITPKEAEFFYHRENEPVATEIVSFPATNFYGMTQPTEKELEDFYTKRQADYRIPDRVQVNYVVFPASNYMAQADKQLGTNLNEKVDQAYLQEGATAFKDEAGKPLEMTAAKAKIKKEMRQYVALTEARKEANSFLNDLAKGHNEQNPFTPGDLQTLAKQKGLAVKTSEPFDLIGGSKELPVPPRNLKVLFSLRADDPDDKDRSMLYAPSPLIGEEAVYVTGLQKRIPSEIQSLSAVHDKAVADYRENKAMELAKAAGARFEVALQSGLAQGKSFDAICASQFLKPQALPPFSLATTSLPEMPEKADFEQLQSAAYNLPTGQSSRLIPTATGGFVVFVKKRLPVDEAAMQRELPGYLAKMREQRQIAAFNEWFGRQLQLHLAVPPDRTGPTS